MSVTRRHGALAILLVASCSPAGSASSSKPSSSSAEPRSSPPGAGADTPSPPGLQQAGGAELLLLLHGLGDRGPNFARALRASELATRAGLTLESPTGAVDSTGRHHWNAGKVCCDFDRLGTDHVAELRARMAARPTIVAGFSNGSFMAQRLACEASEVVGVLSLAGGDPLAEGPACRPARPVPIVHVHGSADHVVPLGGGHVLGDSDRASVPPAEQTMLAWGERNGCEVSAGFAERERLDLVAELPGAETRVMALRGCRAPVELWIAEGATHLGVLHPAVLEAGLAALGRAYRAGAPR